MRLSKIWEGGCRFCTLPAARQSLCSGNCWCDGHDAKAILSHHLVAILLWAPVQVIPGMLAGDAYRYAGAIAGHLMLPIIAGIAGITFLIWGIRRWLKVG